MSERQRADAVSDELEQVVLHARRLVHKIRAEEEARGTPVHAIRDSPWRLDDGGYPAEYVALVRALEASPDE